MTRGSSEVGELVGGEGPEAFAGEAMGRDRRYRIEVAKAKSDLAVRSFFHRIFDSAEEAAGVALEHCVGGDIGQHITSILA